MLIIRQPLLAAPVPSPHPPRRHPGCKSLRGRGQSTGKGGGRTRGGLGHSRGSCRVGLVPLGRFLFGGEGWGVLVSIYPEAGHSPLGGGGEEERDGKNGQGGLCNCGVNVRLTWVSRHVLIAWASHNTARHGRAAGDSEGKPSRHCTPPIGGGRSWVPFRGSSRRPWALQRQQRVETSKQEFCGGGSMRSPGRSNNPDAHKHRTKRGSPSAYNSPPLPAHRAHACDPQPCPPRLSSTSSPPPFSLPRSCVARVPPRPPLSSSPPPLSAHP